MRFEVDPALLPHAPIIAASRGLENAAAAVPVAIARIDVAQLFCLLRITKSVNPLEDRFRMMSELRRLGRCDSRRVIPDAKNLKEPLCSVVAVLPLDGQPAGLMQDLCEEMGEARRRRNAVLLQQRIPALERQTIILTRARRDPSHNFDCPRHANPPSLLSVRVLIGPSRLRHSLAVNVLWL